MKLKVEIPLKHNYKKVFQNFNKKLFSSLNPPWVKAKLARFDGNKKGNTVELELDFILFRQKWISKITEDHEGEDEIYFVDEGDQLPFFLKNWKHKHIIKKVNEGETIIVEDIKYSTPFGKIGDKLLYPLLYAQFAYRKPAYRKYFAKLSSSSNDKT